MQYLFISRHSEISPLNHTLIYENPEIKVLKKQIASVRYLEIDQTI